MLIYVGIKLLLSIKLYNFFAITKYLIPVTITANVVVFANGKTNFIDWLLIVI